jgi:hypothetical protein
MRKKNKIEQELDRKKFENEIVWGVNSQYQRIKVHEKMYEDKNP